MMPAAIPGDPPRRFDRFIVRIAGALGLAILVVACFGAVFGDDQQFAFRDAGHFYYPLYLAVQRQWQAGIIPLWEPAEDGGIPLLGSPQAAVFYPGKLIYAVWPYPAAARIYVVAHVLLAFGAARALLRSWGVSGTGATLAGLAYAFGAPVLFGSSNVIFLVGAAWAPLGLRAADGWLRLGRRGAVAELAAVLALQALGGDIEAAYLTGLASAGYAVALAGRRPVATWVGVAGSVAVLAGWSVLVATGQPWLRGPAVPLVVAGIWAAGLAVLLVRGTRGRDRSPLGARVLGLVAAGFLAVGLGAVQLGPVGMNLATSARWNEANRDGAEDFSLEPYRAVEVVWPNLFGSFLAGERCWLPAIPPTDGHRIWVPSLYLGLLPVLLALGAVGARDGPPGRGWLGAIALVGWLLALGKFCDPAAWFGGTAGGARTGC